MEIAEKIRDFIQSNLVVFEDDLKLGDDDNFFELGFVDSPFAMQLVSFVEKEFQIEVTDNDLDIANFSSIKRLVEFVGKKQGN